MVREKLDTGPLFDSNIIAHHFTPYLRDYDLLIEVPAGAPGGQSYIEGRYRYRFTHCVVAHVTTTIPDDVWRQSWDAAFTVYDTWEAAGQPSGFVWGTCVAHAYPGLRYVADSTTADEWSRRLQHPMHEVVIETNAYTLRLIFHDVVIGKLAEGSPAAGEHAAT